jgi:hypothetical protein
VKHTNFNGPTANISFSNFGQITTAGDPRILPVSMKLIFQGAIQAPRKSPRLVRSWVLAIREFESKQHE